MSGITPIESSAQDSPVEEIPPAGTEMTMQEMIDAIMLDEVMNDAQKDVEDFDSDGTDDT